MFSRLLQRWFGSRRAKPYQKRPRRSLLVEALEDRSAPFTFGPERMFGQGYDGNYPWPRFSVPSYRMTIDYTIPAMRDDRRRQQAENPPRGGAPSTAAWRWGTYRRCWPR